VQKKIFTYEFEDNSPRSVTYECDETERLSTSIQDGVPFVFANRAGMLALAKLLIQLSLGEHEDGFHVHLCDDYSEGAAKPDVLTLLLNEASGSASSQ